MSRTLMKRTLGWKVDEIPSTMYDLGLAPVPVMPTLKFLDTGSHLRIDDSGAGSRWNDVLCAPAAGSLEKEWTGTLENPSQAFVITLSTSGSKSLEVSVAAAVTPDPRGGGRDDNYGPPAGGSWTAQEGS